MNKEDLESYKRWAESKWFSNEERQNGFLNKLRFEISCAESELRSMTSGRMKTREEREKEEKAYLKKLEREEKERNDRYNDMMNGTVCGI